jgi:C5HC2 zinc finger
MCICSGFNCGEAVNFAMGDWFPMGERARNRYALLNRVPLLPHEELLCREASLLSEKKTTGLDISVELHSQLCVKTSFVNLMRSMGSTFLFLNKMGAQVCQQFGGNLIVLCDLCRRDCYVAYVTCNCKLEPICLLHGTYFKRTKRKYGGNGDYKLATRGWKKGNILRMIS